MGGTGRCREGLGAKRGRRSVHHVHSDDQRAKPTGTASAKRLACPVEQIVGQIPTPKMDMVLS